MKLLHVLIFVPVFTLLAIAAQAAQPPQYVQIDLLAEPTKIAPGQEFYLAVKQTIAPGWHTYWVNPGDSGEPMRITWSLPDGFRAGEVAWPTPHRIPYGPLVNFGYEGSMTALIPVQAPDNINGDSVTLTADITWLVCEEICIPEGDQYSITLPVLKDGEVIVNDISGTFARARTALPKNTSMPASFHETNGTFVITLNPPETHALRNAGNVALFPYDWGLVDNPPQGQFSKAGDQVIIKKPRGQRDLANYKAGLFVLGFETDQGTWQGLTVQATNTNPVTSNITTLSITENTTLWQAILFAVLGGLILNLMPCVFPVLSMKALTLSSLGDKEQRQARIHGLLYTTGILLSFAGLAALLIALQQAGATIGWGFQLQSPIVVISLAYLFALIGFNLSGFFDISGRFMGFGTQLAQTNRPLGSFFSGILAVLVATPCTAPFMGVALGFALTQPPYIALSVFLALGLGLALPYLLLSFIPACRHILPKPGAWMERFKQFLAFPMYATAIWLIWVLSLQAGATGVLYALSGMLTLAFAVWLLKQQPRSGFWKLCLAGLSAISILAVAYTIYDIANSQTQTSLTETQQGYTAYTKDTLNDALNGPDPVFVNMTAAWCITCLVNEKVSLDTDKVKAAFKSHNVRYIKGDWTNEDPAITQYLKNYGRSGVPIYVYYAAPAGDSQKRPDPVILPQILTPQIILDLFKP